MNMKKLSIILGLAMAFNAGAQLGFTDASATVFTDSEVASSHPVGITDMNKDGLDDVIRMGSGLIILVDYQQADGTYIEVELGALGSEEGEWGVDNAWGLAIADVDGNGMCDIMAGGFYDTIKIGLVSSDGMTMEVTYAEAEDIFVQGINFFDLDYDGHVDIFACHDDGPSLIVLNDGTGGYTYDDMEVTALLNTSLNGTDEEGSGNYGSCFTDVNNDGYCDLYIAKCRQGVTDNTDPRRINQLWLYDPETNSYNEAAVAAGIAVGAQSWSADFGDIDNDGDMDMYCANHDTNNMLFVNDGTGVFTDVSAAAGLDEVVPFATIQTAMRDFDNDGFIDILATGGTSYIIAMNNGDGTFTVEDEIFSEDINSFGLGDVNNDGYVDILAITGGYGGWGEADDKILMNDGGDHNYLMVDLTGVVSNPDGIGARVTIEGAFGTMIRDVKSGESYGIMNSMISHFGLGQNDTIETLTVTWPSGTVDILNDVDANQTITVEEGGNVGVAELENNVNVNIYPNPMMDELTIDSDINQGKIELLDAQGRLVLSQELNGSKTTLDTSHLPSGHYTWTLNSNKVLVASGKVIKQS
ncbi:MAG: hypothetical protein ACI84C_002005 [Flavobacteriales bacterium]|jgi:hypothetical protein